MFNEVLDEVLDGVLDEMFSVFYQSYVVANFLNTLSSCLGLHDL